MTLRFNWPVQACAKIAVLALLAPDPLQGADAAIDFNRDIRPILSDKCYACHGPDARTRKAKLRLDTQEGALGTDGAPGVIQPGNRAESELWSRITTQDPDDHMPPAETKKVLTPHEVELLGKWIDQGAPWQGHWAFIKPTRPALPGVEHEDWPRNDVDRFILARIEKAGLEPAPHAPKETLIRRASFDLTGLPPTPEEIDAFLADSSPEAYDKLVNRLLDSPRYGEKLAMHWLDLARYADTHGYHLDSGRDMWKWREWVIQAFNDNKPYDQFTLEQLAGDLLPDATLAQKVATGFNRNSMINFEGGAIPEEYLTHYIIDRINTTSTVFLGLTMGCAQCHDHKFDPISQKDFYSFYAFFNAVPENGLDGRNGNATPLVKVPSAEDTTELQRLDTAIRDARQRLEQAGSQADREQAEWEQSGAASLSQRWQSLRPESLNSAAGATLTTQEDQSILASGDNPRRDVHEIIALSPLSQIHALRLETMPDPSLPHTGPGRAGNASFVLSEVTLEAESAGDPPQRRNVRFVRASADYSQKNYEVGGLIDGKDDTGWAIDAPERHKPGTAWLVADEPFGFEGGTRLRISLRYQTLDQHSLGRVRLAVSGDPKAGEGELPAHIAAILQTAPDQRSSDQAGTLAAYYRETHSPTFRQFKEALAALEKEKSERERRIPTSMVMAQMDKPRDTFILVRGQYNIHGDKVEPHVPASLAPAWPDNAPRNRLGLAQWLVHPDHPLMSRVTVNRFWAMVYGTGIVKTANDFGSQAEWPTHPELLDWLATEFIQSGWDVKHMMRLLVTSATYRQDARVTPDLLDVDPYNRLYARGPRFRLSAEEIRDNALAISGLLNGEFGGPSVYPYQPPGLWQELSQRKDSGNWSAQTFVQSEGKDLYRRSMYTFWKRTCPPPSLQTFDAPDRETCVVQRARTSTPLQSLVLLNDPTYVEAARKLAERIMIEGGATPGERMRFAFRLATARQPTEREEAILLELFERQRRRFAAAPDEAAELLQVGDAPRNTHLDTVELAAWTNVAATILNLDETITKG